MITTPLAPYAAHFAIYSLNLPDVVTAFAGGLILGFLVHRHWLRSALLFIAGYVVGSHVDIPLTAVTTLGVVLIPQYYSRDWHIALTIFVFQILAIVPSAILGVWLASFRKRRRDARRAGGLCLGCGYDLTGNVSGRCPECGVLDDPSKIRETTRS